MQLEYAQSSPAMTETQSTAGQRFQPRTIYPLGAYAIHGIATLNDALIALDSVRGYLLKIDPVTDNTTILNSCQVDEFIDATGLAIWENTLWFAREQTVYFCDLNTLKPQIFTTMPYPVDGVGVWQTTIYVSSQKEGYISIFEFNPQRLITRFPLPGVGAENLMIRGEELWLCDRTEQSVYCLDRATGELQFSVLTPYEGPSGLTFLPHPQTGEDLLYVSYAGEEPYIRDNPNNPEGQFELTFRDRTFIHPLYIQFNAKDHYALSNGFLIEMSYAEEMLPLEEFDLKNVEWRIALPAETHRQRVLKVEPIGLPFTEEIQDGQRVAVFRFDGLKFHERHLFGWKALLEVRGIKYLFQPDDVDNIPPLPPEYQARYLVDDDELAMETPIIQQAAREAIGTETNLLRKLLKIRNYVYDRLSYSLTPKIDTPDVVLERGIGSCGEYVGVLLALARLNGIACRTVGRYKCPPKANQQNIPLEPDYNHVWLEFYIPGYGWLPMESNPDDVVERGPYPTRFFMGLPWYHAEIGKGIPFETVSAANQGIDISIGELAINHVRFTILGELPPSLE
ncbi:transglutaminase-like domain-containing protein [Leptothermofonsia sichuanensis]|uniref:transglutaminase-like domain-containing protein n=1 Tax=Leptothermofonsia sichuanensis TaxID=2917832 RepID=UPI001EF02FE1